jgi:hypothetical protein
VSNLLPAFPLDGGRMLRAFLWRRRGHKTPATRLASVIGQVLAAGLVALGVFAWLRVSWWTGVWTIALGAFLFFAARMEWSAAQPRPELLDESIAALTSVLAQMARPLERLDDAAADEMARLALGVGAQLARRELEQHPEQVIEIIRRCLGELPVSNREVRVHLHPADAGAVREKLDPLRSETAWTLVDDQNVGRGGARVILESSQIDARLESRVAVACETVLAESRGAISGDVTAELEAEGGLS